ncbi:MAG: hypothetical protein KA712_12830 [Myxococcales bacterium]|nr:hypothetical protein [Myxococcales bacterium]
MSAKAVTERLRAMSAMQQQRGFVMKGVDMTAAAITSRLKMQSALTRLCLALAKSQPRDPAKSLL